MPPSVTGSQRGTPLVDPAVGLSFDADDLVDLRGVEVDGRGRRCGGRCLHRRLAFAQRTPDRDREFLGIAMPADVHVEGRGRSAEDMIVYRCDLQPVLRSSSSSPD